MVGDRWNEVGVGGVQPAFENDFSNNTGEESLAFRRDADGQVEMKGYPKSTADHQNANEADDTNTVFTLPPRYCPAFKVRCIASSNGLPAHIVILPSGEVRVPFGMKEGVDFSGVRFKTAELT